MTYLDALACPWCDEPVLPDEPQETIMHIGEHSKGPRQWHRECAARSVIGGVNHQLGKCICCGGTEPPDPAALTKRQAARSALALLQRTHRHESDPGNVAEPDDD